jgi:hypothetical protein
MSVVCGILMVLVSYAPATAQTGATAQINGTVKDAQGLPLPGVTVNVTKTDTGLQRTTVTDGQGNYILQSLPVGPYRLEAMLEGFRAFAQSGIVMQVGSNPTIPITLQVGELQETVTVSAAAALVETRNPGIGQVVTNQQVLELPLNGRQLQELVFQAGLATGGSNKGDAPGASDLNTGVRTYPNTTIVVAGGTSDGMVYNLDGATHNEPYNNLSLPLPFPDAMQEFKVETSGLSAQYGQHSAAAVNAVTKAGTNTFHGDGFEFMRDHRLNATNAFAALGANGKPLDDGLHRDQFGGTLGGPIVPGKLFFFGGYQATRVDVTPATLFAFVPTPAMLAGDFTTITSPACTGGRQISLKAPFVNNTISPSQFSPAGLQLAGRMPKPVNECGQVFFSRTQPTREHLPIGRIDYQMSNSQSMFVRYQRAQFSSPSDVDPNNALAISRGNQDDTVQSLVVGHTLVRGSNLVNTMRFARTFSDINKQYVPFFDAADLGVRNFVSGLPHMTHFGVTGAFDVGTTNITTSDITSGSVQFADDLSLVRGAHQFGFGANYIRSTIEGNNAGRSVGNFTFNGGATGLSMADMLLGRFSSFDQANPYTASGTQPYLGVYGQDAWRASKYVTLNAGLRWEPYLSFSDPNRQLSHFDMDQFRAGVHSTVFHNAPAGIIFQGDPEFPRRGFAERYWANFAPRVAAVWDPRADGRMTVRAAFGRYSDLPALWLYSQFARSTPFGSAVIVNGGNFDDPWATTPGGNPYPFVPTPDMTFPQYGTFFTLPIDYKPPYSNQWNLSFQRQLGAASMVSANYLENYGRRLTVDVDINQAVYSPGATLATTNQRRLTSLLNPVEGQYYGQIQEIKPIGQSEYRALLLTLQNRSLKGLSLSGNWTIAKCESDPVVYLAQSGSEAVTNPENPAFDHGSCGASDQRHVVNVTTVYQIPGAASGLVGALTRDWQVSAIVAARSGRHFNVVTNVDNALNGQASSQRPNIVSNDVYIRDGVRWLNPKAFEAPATGTFGNMPINAMIGPSRFNINMAIVRSLPVGDRRLQLRAEAFNVFNTVEYDDPTTTLTSPKFGQITSAADPRIIQLALKYTF